VRVWPAGSPWITPGTLGYPLRQGWFASMTQMANEPVYVDAGEVPGAPKIYYHSGLDNGGAEGLIDVVAATDGRVASSGLDVAPGEETSPVEKRYDVVYLVDRRGWYYRYSTWRRSTRPSSRAQRSRRVKKSACSQGGGQRRLVAPALRDQGAATLGKWGTEEGYAFLWQRCSTSRSRRGGRRPTAPRGACGRHVTLDGSSRGPGSAGLPIPVDLLRWHHDDRRGGRARLQRARHVQRGARGDGPRGPQGVRLCGGAGVRPRAARPAAAGIHAAYAPTTGIKVGDPVTFKVRTFRVGATAGTRPGISATAPARRGAVGRQPPPARPEVTRVRPRLRPPGDYSSASNGKTAPV